MSENSNNFGAEPMDERESPVKADVTPEASATLKQGSGKKSGGSPGRKESKPRKAKSAGGDKKRESNGLIGHNSRNAIMAGDAEATQEENVEPRHFSDEIKTARDAVYRFIDASAASNKLVLPATNTAIVALYALVFSIYESGANDAFRAEHGIAAHGNSDNHVQPLVAYGFRTIIFDKKYVRYVVSRWGQVIAVLLDSKVPPDEVASWLESHGIEEALRQYRALKAARVRANQNWAAIDAREALAREIMAEDANAPLCDATPITSRESTGGFRAATIELESSLTGKYRLRALLPGTSAEVIEMMAKIAEKKRNATE